jgi:hypothetical protein
MATQDKGKRQASQPRKGNGSTNGANPSKRDYGLNDPGDTDARKREPDELYAHQIGISEWDPENDGEPPAPPTTPSDVYDERAKTARRGKTQRVTHRK